MPQIIDLAPQKHNLAVRRYGLVLQSLKTKTIHFVPELVRKETLVLKEFVLMALKKEILVCMGLKIHFLLLEALVLHSLAIDFDRSGQEVLIYPFPGIGDEKLPLLLTHIS